MQNTNQYNFQVEDEEEGFRLDQFLSRMMTAQSRSFLQKLIKQGNILVNGSEKKSSYEVRLNDQISVVVPDPVELDVLPENIPLSVIYEDNNLLVVNKPAGLVVHPAVGHFEHTLVNALLYHCGNTLSGIGGVLRPGIVHRLDKDTSGCIIVAKDDITHNNLVEQFQEREIYKEYRAIVSGWVKELNGKIETIIGRHPVDRKKMAVRTDTGKEALSEYEVLERFETATLLAVRIGTGRTHQIRVQMSHIGHPVLGDEEYGKKRSRLDGVEIKRQMLHSYRIGFNHPIKKEWMDFIAPMPEDMQELLNFIKRTRK
jgi:23S rRNA pseudouridine1911/1915/1917 synthase